MAMSVIWVGMLVVSMVCAGIQGNTAALSGALMEGAKSAVTLCLTLAGTICLWSGLSKLMERAGITNAVSRFLRPVLHRLYPNASKNPEAFAPLCANVCANLLGLGNAATPLGIRAVNAMKPSPDSTQATDEMCRLIVMNTASIQLLPTTVAAVRAGAGSAQPFAILPAVWVTSICSVAVGLSMCYFLQRWVS